MSGRLNFKRENTLKGKVPNKPGLYKFYGKGGRMIYVGHARKLRHRIQSYNEKDCYRTHPTKRVLRKKIAFFSYSVMPKKQAQRIERRLKKKTPYNVL